MNNHASILRMLVSLMFFTHMGFAQDLIQTADSLLAEGQYEEAIKTYHEAIPYYQEKQDYTKYADAHANTLYALYYQGNYQEMIDFIAKHYPTLKQTPTLHDSTLAVFPIYQGLAYRSLEDYGNAYTSYKQAYQLQNQYGATYNLINIIESLAYICRNRGDYKGAIDFYKKSIDLKLQLNDTQTELVSGYISLASSYKFNRDYTESLQWLEKANKEVSKISNIKQRNAKTATILNNTGHLYFTMEDYPKALAWYHKSLDFKKTANRSLIVAYYNLGSAYIGQKEFYTALPYIQQGYQSTLKKYKKKKHSKKARGHNIFSKAYLGLEKYDSALWHMQRAIINFLPTFNDSSIYSNPSLEVTSFEDALLFPLARKGIAFTGKALQSNSKKDRDLAIASFWKAMELIDKMRQQFEVYGSKSKLAQHTWWVFEAAIKGSMDLYQATGDRKYLVSAFQFAEKSKAILMQDAMNSTLAGQQVGIPQNLQNQEHQLKLDISQLENNLYQAEKKNKTERAAKLRSELLKKREDLRLFGISLEEEYPAYHQIKFKRKETDLIQLQESLQKSQAIFEYFLGDEQLYVFSITNEKLSIYASTIPQNLEQLVTNFRLGLKPDHNLSDIDAYKTFAQNSYELFRTILGNTLEKLPNNISELTIIPDGSLNYIPFELLLTEQPDVSVFSYQQMAYLLKDYQVNYAYAASLLANPLKNINNPTKEGILAFAPSYSQTITDSVELQQLSQFRDQVGELIWNTKEVEAISALLPSTTFTEQEATEEKFKEMASEYPIIHLAMHALLDDENPQQSRLVFTKTNSEKEDRYLNAYELYNMKLNADLAILSACNTGAGKYVRGEGIASLGRAFAYAGCPNVVISHWSVDDAATSKLMKLFYAGLADGMGKAQALRQAKLHYLETAKPREANPIYWGSFILIGDDEPIQKTNRTWLWITALGFITFAVFLTLKKNKR